MGAFQLPRFREPHRLPPAEAAAVILARASPMWQQPTSLVVAARGLAHYVGRRADAGRRVVELSLVAEPILTGMRANRVERPVMVEIAPKRPSKTLASTNTGGHTF